MQEENPFYFNCTCTDRNPSIFYLHVQEENLKSVNTESNGKVTYYSLNSTYFFNYVFGISDKMIEILCSCRRLHQYNEDDFLFQL